MIRAEQVTKKYVTKSGDVLATDHIDLDFSSNGLYVLLGKSGCGKTTLLNILSGLDSYDEGKLYINNEDIGRYNELELDCYRNLQMGVIFQDFNLISELSVYDNLRLVLEIQNWEGKSDVAVQNLIRHNLEKVGLSGYERRKISELSGGERQRVAIARTLVKQPHIIFADEPTGNLDTQTGTLVFEILKQISEDYVVIVVTHDREFAYRYADTIIQMENGHIYSIEEQAAYQENIYSLLCQQNGDAPEVVQELTHDQLVRFIVGLIDKTDMDGAIHISELKKRKIDQNTSTKDRTKQERATEKSAQVMPWQHRIALAFSFLKKKKLTLILTICILAISSALFFAALTATFYQTEKTIITYLRKYQPEILPIYLTTSYEDSFFNTHTETLTKGAFLTTLLDSTIGDLATKLEASYGNDCYVITEEDDNSKSVSGVTMLFIPEEYTGFVLAKGSLPQNNNEVMITDYLSSELDVNVGDQITNNEIDVKVCGIIQTDYIGYELKAKLTYGSNSPYVDYYLQYRYNVIYCRSELLHTDMRNSQNRIRLALSDFTCSHKEISYRESELFYDSSAKVMQSTLAAGRMPLSENEILVSTSFAEDRNMYNDIAEFQETVFQFSDINDESLRNCFSMNINLYSYFPDGVRVVGVVSNFDGDNLDADVYLTESKWNAISQDYYDNYMASVVYAVDPENQAAFVEILSGNRICIEEPAISQIYSFSDVLRTMRPFLFALLLLTAILNAFMLTNFIQISIRSNRKNVGILRALGVPMQNVSQLFSIEALVLYFCSNLLSVPLISIVQNIANRVYSSGIVENPYQIITWNWFALAIVLIVEAAINALSLQVPMRKLKRTKPIELIR